MSAVPPALAAGPLPDDRKALLARVVEGLDSASLWWLSGFTAGLAQAAHPAPHLALLQGTAASAAAPATGSGERATVLYGSQTGNAKRAAEALAATLEGAGLAVRLVRTDTYATRELAAERLLYLVISTQGEGDPPDDAIGFSEFLLGRRAPKLPELKFAVLGLGDSSYADFCGISRRLDARLAELGATRLLPAGEADLDIDTVAQPWREQALEQARKVLKSAPAAPSAKVTPLRPAPATQAVSHSAPFQAEVLANQPIAGRDFKGPAFGRHGAPDKQVRHIELSLEGSGLSYEPGDALGIVHRNPDALVEPLLAALKLDGDAAHHVDGTQRSVREWLAGHRELSKLSRPFLAAHARLAGARELEDLLAPGNADLSALLSSHQVIDVLRRWPVDWNVGELLAALRPLAPRLYSIASSRKRVGEEVHLTVDVLGYHAHGHAHSGSASGFLAGLAEGDRAPVYIEANDRFRVPADGARDILMVGPGTGVAPFRAFVQERAETGARGRNWLFFGAQHFNSGFLYQSEWQDALRRGELDRLDLAFSRDQADKLYVQHRLRERGREVFDWLQSGAHFYVCGSIAMGKDVHAALTDIVAEHGALDADAAHDYLTTLQTEGRYARDVY
ncbi:assimilatory sulfite reductase (NADPH) flavoprotein subunit [Pseudoxanthomonas winnipegensis]|uniref:assimilatory sulfite reductase (NADPH) flavoprotein subunit n=1 Tax=Pseudoxanthomonas winnipegensis TaxID=2480810 RepID=UPI00103CF443|nr:assimilatory sulfite reductase (NADPH) flavoprotein subunit [Pseudoxanthomonas winnipegensis]TBV73007.1 assimilatory sulfite reductase (NADPH) flavoprotein subunit [Pseudoxanthomonas winnipegensis]